MLGDTFVIYSTCFNHTRGLWCTCKWSEV